MKILIRLNTNDSLVLDADTELVERLSAATVANCTTDYSGIITGLTPTDKRCTIILLSNSDFKKLSVPAVAP